MKHKNQSKHCLDWTDGVEAGLKVEERGSALRCARKNITAIIIAKYR